MTRADIKEMFRTENPDITDRVISDALLDDWCIQGNLDIAIKARMITDEFTFTSIEDSFSYDLTSYDSKFYDVDEMPGGGVEYDGKRKDKVTMAEISMKKRQWRSRTAAEPQEYCIRGKFLWFDRPSEASKTIRVYDVQIPDSFDDDNKTPFNEMLHLEPFHYGIVKYLEWKAKGKIEKGQAEADAARQYNEVVSYAKKEVTGQNLDYIRYEDKCVRSGGRRR